jgi:hypothetical protein
MVFSGVLPNSRDVSNDLRSLGLDDSYARFIGTHAYSPGSPLLDQKFENDFARRVTPVRLAWFFATHPRAAIRQFKRALDFAATRPANLGNFERSEGRGPGAKSYGFALVSSLKDRAFRERGWLYLSWCLAVSGSLLWFTRANAGAVTLVLITFLALAIGALGDHADPDRHLFVFSALADLTLVGVIGSSGLASHPAPETPSFS